MGSTRLKDKPLIDINGKPMIQHVYESVAKALPKKHVYVATDSTEVMKAVSKFDGGVVYVPDECESGTHRCQLAYEKLLGGFYMNKKGKHKKLFKGTPDVIINVQGDEPLIRPDHIDQIKRLFIDPNVMMATLCWSVLTQEELDRKKNCAYVVFNEKFNAMYFSRKPIPVVHWGADGQRPFGHTVYRTIGIYAFRPAALKAFTLLKKGPLETAERLEQLRWLEHTGAIRVAISDYPTYGVDTQADLERVRAIQSFSGREFNLNAPI